jgi:Holliday junction resolvase
MDGPVAMPDESNAQERLIDQRLRLMYEACEQAGINAPLTREDIIRRFEALERGLPAEDEFAVLVNWLGNCRLIHKLDQQQFPQSSGDLYQVPDFLAVFENKNRIIPTLIEVKKTKKTAFKWSKKYYSKLKAYADLLNLPLLIAWKFRPDKGQWAIWTLFDAQVFDSPDSSYKVTLKRASGENLLGQLAGDFLIDVKAGVGLHLQIDLIGGKDEWKRMKDANKYFGKLSVFWTDGSGNRIDTARISPGLLSLLNCIPFLSDSSLLDAESYMIQSFALQDNRLIFAHQMLPLLLIEAQTSTNDEIRWRGVLNQDNLPTSAEEIYKAASEAANDNVVELIFHQVPKTTPAFLPQGRTTE